MRPGGVGFFFARGFRFLRRFGVLIFMLLICWFVDLEWLQTYTIKGLMDNAISEMFTVAKEATENNLQTEFALSVLEVYNDEIIDLLGEPGEWFVFKNFNCLINEPVSIYVSG